MNPIDSTTRGITLYLHVHQPWRVRQYSIFDVASRHDYFSGGGHSAQDNEQIFHGIAEKSYLEMNRVLERTLANHPEFKLSLSISGVFLEQAQPASQHGLCFLYALTLGGREQLDAGVCAPALVNILTNLEQCVLGSAEGQLVGLGQQDVQRHAAGLAPVEHHVVELGQRVTDVHHQHQSAQAFAAAQVGFQMLLPVLLERNRYLGVTVTRQVDQAALVIQAEEVEQLGTTRGLRGTRQVGVGQGVQRARLAGVGTAGEGHFQALVVRALVDLGGADEEGCLLAQAENGVLG